MAEITPREIYQKDRDIASCVEIIAALVSYKGGYFYIGEEGNPASKHQTPEKVLDEIARDIYIDGIALAELRISDGKPELFTVPSGKKPLVPAISFDYLNDTGLLKQPRSPLGMAAINYESEEAMRRAIVARPELGTQLHSLLRPTTGQMGFPAWILDQRGIGTMQGWQIAAGLWTLSHVVDELRHFMRASINESCLDIDDGRFAWDWNIEFRGQGIEANHAPFFHVFRRFGLDLTRLRDYEIAAAKAAVEIGYPHSLVEMIERAYL